jgi:Mg-chelatase subunit ChlD
MDKLFKFRIEFACGSEYDFTLPGSVPISAIFETISKDVKLTLTIKHDIFCGDRNITGDYNEQISDMKYFFDSSEGPLEMINELKINIPLLGNMDLYLDSVKMDHEYGDDEELKIEIKEDKKKKKDTNMTNSITSKNTHTNTYTNTTNSLNKTEDPTDLYQHPEKKIKLITKSEKIGVNEILLDVVKIPMLVTIDVDEFSSNPKTTMDLICIIDKSGSMSGEKIKLLIESLQNMLIHLSDRDRLSLVIFDDKATRLCPLLCMNDSNKDKVRTLLAGINPDGGTNIGDGLKHSLEMLAQRTRLNNISTVFLLTDGLDSSFTETHQKQIIRKIDNIIAQGNIDFDYTINSFGYGSDHDPLTLSTLSQMKNGNFYFINELGTINLCFEDCLSTLQKIICRSVNLNITPQNKVKIIKAYGVEGAWKVLPNGNYTTTIYNLPYKKKLNFIFEIEIPKMNKTSLNSVKSKGLLLAKCKCEIKGLMEFDYPKSVIDSDCIGTFVENYNYANDFDNDIFVQCQRVKYADLIKILLACSSKGKYDEALIHLTKFESEINSYFAFDRIKKDKSAFNFLGCLMKDIDKTKDCIDEKNFSRIGKHYLMESYLSHMCERNNFNSSLVYVENKGEKRRK